MCKSGTVNTFDYEDKIWTKPRNVIIEIYDYYNIPNTNFKYDYLVTFDRESILLKTPNSSSNTSKLKFISTHVAVSASITSNIPNFTNAKFILSTNPRDLCDQIFAYFDELSAEAMRLMHIKFNQLLSLNLDKQFRQRLVDYCSSLPS